jgi:integrase
MSEDKPRYFVEKPQKGGSVLYYWQPSAALKRAGYKTVRLNRDRASAIREAEALNAKVDQWRGGLPVGAENTHGTIPWIIEQYKKSVDYYNLRARTKIGRKYEFARILKWSAEKGDPPIRSITKADVEAPWKQIHDDEGHPPQAVHIINRCCTLWNWAIDHNLGVVETNPFSRLKLKPIPPREQVWTQGQLDAVREMARATPAYHGGGFYYIDGRRTSGRPVGFRQSIADAVTIGEQTCLREGDILALNWSQYDGKYLTVMPSKTKDKTRVTVRIPVTGELKATLDRLIEARREPKVVSLANASDGPILVNESTGQRWGQVVFITHFRAICRAAGIPDDMQFRDLRRTGATRLAEAGCTPHEIAALGGWPPNSPLIAKVYAKANVTMADNAILKLEAYRKRKLEV